MRTFMSVAVGFRALQAIHDLVGLVAAAPEATLRRLAAGVPTADMSPDDAYPAIMRLVHDDRCHFTIDRTLPLHETLLLAATMPDDDFDGFTVATMILLANSLQGGPGPEDLYWHWDAFAEQYLLADPHRSAALILGFHAMVATGRLPESHVHLAPVSGVDIGRVLADLRAIAAHAGDATLSAIAAADYGDQSAEHLSALKAVIGQQGCILAPGQERTPSEVIELAAHDPAHPGHLVATAILLVTALARGDVQGWFSYRWEQQAAIYDALPPAPRWAVLSAIRFLYETDPGFAPYPQALFDPAGHRARLIPLLGPTGRAI
jgi:hypothetical protein